MTKFCESVNLISYNNGQIKTTSDLVVREKQLTVLFNGCELTSILCSSGNYKELVAGFLFNRGLLKNINEIKQLQYDEALDSVTVVTYSSELPATKTPPRFKIDPDKIQQIESDCRFRAQHITYLMRKLEENAQTFRLTGGVHSAALADQEKIHFIYEDIGRHNAVDKVLGHVFLKGITTDDKCLLLSGRIQSDILVKVAQNNIPLVVSGAAPGHLVIELGNRLNITVIGFARLARFSIYSHAERVVL